MAQPTVSDVHLDAPLTNISVMYLQDQTDYVAWQVFPEIPVEHQSDKYYIYDKDYWFRSAARRRAPGTESAGTGYKLSRDGLYCDIFALHHDIADPERSNQDTVLDADADSTLLVTRQLVLKQEIDWAAKYFKTGVWGTDATPVVPWSDDASTPIEDILAAEDAVLQTTGMQPNTLVLPRKVFTRFLQHPEFVDRIKYGGTAGGAGSRAVTKNAMAELLDIDRILVSKSVLNSAAEGLPGSYDFVMGDAALLAYANPSPGLRRPSAGYTFFWRDVSGGMGENVGVKKFRMEALASDRIEGQIAYDYKVVGNDLGYFFANVL